MKTKKQLIGRGTFTKAYLLECGNVEVVSSCPAKECYALFSQGNPLAPVIKKIDYLDSGEGVYMMPLYPKVKAPSKQLNAQGLHIYKELRKLHCKPIQSYHDFVNAVDTLSVEEECKENIKELAGDVSNGIDCFDLRFEISPRNVSVDKEGGLVMLDCFFSVKLLRELKEK